MSVVDFYLRDQVIRGDLTASQGRPLDLLNNRLDTFVILDSALLMSLHVGAEPVKLGPTRLHKDQLLLVVPHDQTNSTASPNRSGWVEKKSVRAVAGIGPLIVTGNFHIGQWEAVSLEKLGRETDGRIFLPVTQAKITSLYHPAWAVEAGAAFVSRSALGYISLLTADQDAVTARLAATRPG
jgi:hypothetical protein